MNVIQTWLYLIGTKERAVKLRDRVDDLTASRENEARQCPTTVLFGLAISRKLYTDPKIRPALDAWDTEEVSAQNIKRWCTEVERGLYRGPIYDPVFSSRSSTFSRVV